MSKHVLFIQGASPGAHAADAQLVDGLRSALSNEYDVIYPAMPNEVDPQYTQWKRCIEEQLAAMQGPAILVGHSVGASMILKSLSEYMGDKPVAGVFLLATPFWGGDGWRYEGYKTLELPKNMATQLPQGMRVFLYHCRDDDTVPYHHLVLYKTLLPGTVARPLDRGGHQFSGDMPVVAADIKRLA